MSKEYNSILKIGNCFTGVENCVWEVGKQYDWEYRLCHIKSNSDYTEFYWLHPLEYVYLGSSLEDACKELDRVHDEEQEIYESPELPENVIDLEHARALANGDIPF